MPSLWHRCRCCCFSEIKITSVALISLLFFIPAPLESIGSVVLASFWYPSIMRKTCFNRNNAESSDGSQETEGHFVSLSWAQMSQGYRGGQKKASIPNAHRRSIDAGLIFSVCLYKQRKALWRHTVSVAVIYIYIYIYTLLKLTFVKQRYTCAIITLATDRSTNSISVETLKMLKKKSFK